MANPTIFKLLKETVTPKDIEQGANPETFAYAHLIAWAVKHKKFEEYYSYMRQFKEDQDKFDAQKKLISDMTVIVRFDCAGTPLFGFYGEIDGEGGLCFPTEEGMKAVYL